MADFEEKEQSPATEEEARPAEGAEVVSVEDAEALDPELPLPSGAEVTAVAEALLFATTQPLSLKRLSLLMNGVPEEEISAALEDLRARYGEESCGLILMEVAGGWQVATKPETADWVLRLHKHRRKNPLTPSLMESLAIIAYKQPITRADVEAIRGVDCGTAARSLQDAGLVEVVGRKDVVGRPPLYGTTELFLKTFGLRSIDELPSAGELRAVMEAPMKKDEGGSSGEAAGEATQGGSPAEEEAAPREGDGVPEGGSETGPEEAPRG